jgi:hypothetical protein
MNRKYLFGVLLWVLSGCTYLINLGLASPPTVKVEEISQEQNRIKVEGIVLSLIPLINGFAYELEDETGSVWVVTGEQKPRVGDTLSVEGMVKYQDFMIDGEDQGSIYLEQVTILANDSDESAVN